MSLYRVTYLGRSGSRAYCTVKADDHREAIRLASQDHDDVIGVQRIDEQEEQQKKGSGVWSVIGVLATICIIAGLGVLIHYLRSGASAR